MINKLLELKEKVKNGDFDDNELIDLVLYLERENKVLLEENKKYKEVIDKTIEYIKSKRCKYDGWEITDQLYENEIKQLLDILKEVK